jgi:transposase-like protein
MRAIVDLYASGASIQAVADAFGCAHTTVLRNLRNLAPEVIRHKPTMPGRKRLRRLVDAEIERDIVRNLKRFAARHARYVVLERLSPTRFTLFVSAKRVAGIGRKPYRGHVSSGAPPRNGH